MVTAHKRFVGATAWHNGLIDQAALINALEVHDLYIDQLASRTQREIVLQFAAFYEKHGFILGEEAPSLRLCCPHGEECWRGAGDRRRDVDKGAITIPWVGPAYRPGGVLILGVNFNDAEGIAMSFELADWERRAFAQGKKRMYYDSHTYGGSNFAYCSTRSAGLLVDFADGASIRDRQDPVDLMEILDRIVRLQAVKCSPRNAKSSKPTRSMWARCPPMLLADELAIARPRHVIAFGADLRHALNRLPTFHLHTESQRVYVGTLEIPSGEAQVYIIDHPRALAYWPISHTSLRRYLQRARAAEI